MIIEKNDLIEGGIYRVDARGYYVAIWNGEAFKGPGLKDGVYEFLYEGYYMDGYPNGTVTPTQKLGELNTKPPHDGSNLLAAMVALNEMVYNGI
jgi:hypothetical protein